MEELHLVLTQILFLSLAVSAISMTLTRSAIFSTPREWILKRNEFLGRLLSCPYCTNHWLSAAAVAVYQPRPVSSETPGLDWVVSAFALVALSSFSAGLIHRAFAFSHATED